MATDQTFATVILDEGIDKPLDYVVPPEFLPLHVGSRVIVPIRRSLKKGTIVALKHTTNIGNVLPIVECPHEDPLIPPEILKLAGWMATYYCTPLRRALKSILPASIRKETKPKLQKEIRRLMPPGEIAETLEQIREKRPSQARVLEVMIKKPQGILLTELLELAKVSQGPIDQLIKENILKSELIPLDRSPLDEHEFFITKPKTLTPEQQKTFDTITHALEEKSFHPHLIHGITGSGKTEIYLQAISHARSLNRGVIMLVPEIALTSQTIERFRARFTERIGILHHRLSDGERHDVWHAIRKGEINIIIGARSAIFCPVRDLGLILVDEEHDSSYKQTDEQPCYHARDIAIVRAKLANAAVILGSATPSLESYTNALEGKYHLSKLTTRAQNAKRPKITLVDLKREQFRLLTDPLIDAIKARFEKGEQSLLFLNRRGYHTFQICTACGESVKCKSCDVSLTFHKAANLLACHICGYHLKPPPIQCLSCKHKESLKFKGAGTEQIERTLHAILPNIRTLRMDADTTRHKGSHDRLFKEFRSGKADVLIGTQMIAKGLHFPAVTLVGIINSDGAMNLPDFRASESTFQLITQVAGRSGRSELSGEVIIQTSMPNNAVIRLASEDDYEGFYEYEMTARELLDYPPKTHLAKLTFSGSDLKRVEGAAQESHQQLKALLPPSFTIYPVTPCGYFKIKDNYRYKLLIKGDKIYQLSHFVPKLTLPYNVRLLVDVDPLSTFA